MLAVILLILRLLTLQKLSLLLEKGCVERRRDEQDKRVTKAVLTKQGHEMMERIFPEHAATINSTFAVLTDEELAILLLL